MRYPLTLMVASVSVTILSLLAVGTQIILTIMVYNYMKQAEWGRCNFLRNDWPSRLFSTVLAWFGVDILLSVIFVKLRGLFPVIVVGTWLLLVFWLYRAYRGGRAEAAQSV